MEDAGEYFGHEIIWSFLASNYWSVQNLKGFRKPEQRVREALGQHIARITSCTSINNVMGEPHPSTIGWAHVVIPPERHIGFKITQDDK